jgi:hypothetical protein
VEAAVLKRRYRMMPGRAAAFVDVRAGTFLHEDGTAIEYRSPVGLVEILDLLDGTTWGENCPETVYIVGCFNAASTPKIEWFAAPLGWERSSYHRNPLIAVYKRDRQRVHIYGSAQWFGECMDLQLVRRAYSRLRALLKGNFGDAVNIMGTPARTGLDLIERSLPERIVDKVTGQREPYVWPVLPEDIRQVIEHNIGQGRMEMLRQGPNTPQVDKLYIEDAFWMYAACCRRLPSPPVQHDMISEFAGYRQGFYRAEFQVPVGWSHIGLLPTWNPRDRRTIWPSRPSTYWYTSYCGAEELRLALEKEWPVRIKERWLFAEGDGLAVDPLRNWIDKLRQIRAACTDEREGADLGPLLRGAIRSICIKAIGGLHRKGRYQVVETPLRRLADIPDDADIIWRTETHIRWRKPIPLDPSMAHFAHPEWSACIWWRSRARLARAALELPRETIIALRSDALALTFDPGWRGERPGEFRLKRVVDLAGRPLPRTTREYLDLLQEPEDEE